MKCTRCNALQAYVGFSDVKCVNKECPCYDKAYAEESTCPKPKTGEWLGWKETLRIILEKTNDYSPSPGQPGSGHVFYSTLKKH